ncbi:BadF/BadG/BcrA/BcrD ATPase family protein [Kribbella solani]|uniref:N-acetylglucosamine kinase n=1 Tax=Kribbella solani TaxID=236067 RepID=UPI0029BA7BAF|nr:BadF/BadG/BcrA/BcrD ATPase family protein [Kribbella solani]MDX2969109.1 BadF/BadG/BcrA/BcrD ATPase family protein [Kribbella solani]MDX3001395.1 BadF/BadG/BcrA/BcrD ATPase family protein [Kribbella solani]
MNRIAIDGGQSALRLRVAASGRTGTGPGYTHGPDALMRMLDAIRVAAAEVELQGPVDVVALGLTGYPQAPGVAERFAGQVGELLDADEVRLTQDMVTAHAGALPAGYGVVVAAGTGLVCLAVDRDGTWRKLDGHGYLFGDAGSAFAIGRAGLVAVQRARDGRGPVTKLADTAIDPVLLYRSSTLVDDVARFAPEVLRCAAEGDPVAHDVLVRAAGDIAETIGAAVAQLAGEGPVPVACVGGLFAGAGEQLLTPVRAALPARARLIPAAGNSLDGAERLATGPTGTYADLIVTYRR